MSDFNEVPRIVLQAIEQGFAEADLPQGSVKCLVELHQALSDETPIDLLNLAQAALRWPQLLNMQPAKVVANVRNGAAVLGISLDRYQTAFLALPSLTSLASANLERNVAANAAFLEVSRERYIESGLAYPTLLCLNPETFKQKVEQTIETLDLTKAAYLQMAKTHPSILQLDPDSVANKVIEISKSFDVDMDEARRIVRLCPLYLTRNVDSLQKNAKVGATLLGVAPEKYAELAGRFPALLTQLGTTLNANVDGSAAALGVTRDQFIGLACSQPVLLSLKSEKFAEKKKYLQGIAAALGREEPFFVSLRSFPGGLTLREENLYQKYVWTQMMVESRGFAKPPSFGAVLKKSALDVLEEVVVHYTGETVPGQSRAEKQARLEERFYELEATGVLPPRPGAAAPVRAPVPQTVFAAPGSLAGGPG